VAAGLAGVQISQVSPAAAIATSVTSLLPCAMTAKGAEHIRASEW
jgi:hypothetical protein